MDRRTALKKLKKLAQEQHQILNELADMPSKTSTPVSGSHFDPDVQKHGDEANQILAALPPAVKLAVRTLEVPTNLFEVRVRFFPGKGTDAIFNTIVSVVNQLQNANKLPGKSYQVKEVA